MQPKIFFAHHKSIGIILPKTIFDVFRAISMKIHRNREKSLPPHVWVMKKCSTRRTTTSGGGDFLKMNIKRAEVAIF